MSNKDYIRKSLLKERQEKSIDFIKEASEKICFKFYQMFSAYKSFLLYAPIKNEVNILPLAERLHDEGKQVYLPSIVNGEMCFKLFEGLSFLEEGYYRILEAKGVVLSYDPDVLAAPGIAFDRQCFRLGYGKGFYDRFLASAAIKIKVGVSYDFQVVSTIYPEVFDQPVDLVLTENQCIRRFK